MMGAGRKSMSATQAASRGEAFRHFVPGFARSHSSSKDSKSKAATTRRLLPRDSVRSLLAWELKTSHGLILENCYPHVMSSLKKFRSLACLVAAGVLITACASGTESTGTTLDTDGRNTAIIGDRGLPYDGLSSFETMVAVDQTTRAPWMGSRRGSISRGLVTGGGMIVQTPKFSTLDPTFPRVNGDVSVAAAIPGTDEFVIGGNFIGVGAKNDVLNLAIIGPNGPRPGFDVKMNGRVLSIAVKGDLLYIAGYFSYVTDLTSNQSGPRPGFAVVNHRTGQLLANPPMASMVQDRTFVEKIALSPNSNLAALVIRDNGVASNVMTLVRVYDVTTGAIASTFIPGAPRVYMSGVGNGMTVVQTSDASGQRGPLTLLNISTGQTVATFVPGGLTVDSFYAGENRVRVLATGGARHSLVDLNPATFASVGVVEIPATTSNPSDLVWASGTQALFYDGRVMDTTTGQTVQLINMLEGSVLAGLLTSRGLFVGGTFGTAFSGDIGRLIRVPEDGSLPSRTTATANLLPASLVTTPKGVVAMDGFSVKLLSGTGDPISIAQLNPIAAPCAAGAQDMAARGNIIFVAGCWTAAIVGRDTTSDRAMEIDIAANPPRIIRTYRLFDDTNVRKVAIGAKSAAVVSWGASNTWRFFDRETGVTRLVQMYDGDVRNIELVSVGGFEEAVIGGWSLGVSPLNNNGLPEVRSASLVRVKTAAGSAVGVDWVEGPTHALASGVVDGRDTLVIAGSTLLNGVTRSVTLVNLADFTPRTDFNFGADNFVSSVALDADRLWTSGLFRSLTFNGQDYMAPGISAIDLSALKVYTRGSIVNTAPTTTVADETPVTIEQPNLVEPTTTTMPEKESTATVEVLPPAIPQNGAPKSGTYTFAENSGGTRTVVVSDNGTLEFSSPTGSNATRRPAISRIVPVNKGLKVTWFPVKGATKYTVTAITRGARKTCSTKKLSCTISKLNPWQAYTLSVEAITGKTRVLSDVSPKVKPVVTVGKKSSTSLRSVVAPSGKGTASWKTTTPCKVSGSRLVAPKAKGFCTVTVKVGKSTRSVRVNVG